MLATWVIFMIGLWIGLAVWGIRQDERRRRHREMIKFQRLVDATTVQLYAFRDALLTCTIAVTKASESFKEFSKSFAHFNPAPFTTAHFNPAPFTTPSSLTVDTKEEFL